MCGVNIVCFQEAWSEYTNKQTHTHTHTHILRHIKVMAYSFVK